MKIIILVGVILISTFVVADKSEKTDASNNLC